MSDGGLKIFFNSLHKKKQEIVYFRVYKGFGHEEDLGLQSKHCQWKIQTCIGTFFEICRHVKEL